MLRGSSDARNLESKDDSTGKSSHSTHGETVPVEEQGRIESSDEDDPREMRMKNLDSGVEYNVGKVRLQKMARVPTQFMALASMIFYLCIPGHRCRSLAVDVCFFLRMHLWRQFPSLVTH